MRCPLLPSPSRLLQHSLLVHHTSSVVMDAAIAALKRMHTALTSARSGRDEKKSATPWLEPGPLPRAAKTGGCRLPTLEMITEACKKHKKDTGTHLHGSESTTFTTLSSCGNEMRSRPGSVLATQSRCELFTKLAVSSRTPTPFADTSGGRRNIPPSLVPNLENLGLEMDKRFGEEENRIPAFSLPFTALDNQLAPLTAEETVNIHPRLQCTLLHKPAAAVATASHTAPCTFSLPVSQRHANNKQEILPTVLYRIRRRHSA